MWLFTWGYEDFVLNDMDKQAQEIANDLIENKIVVRKEEGKELIPLKEREIILVIAYLLGQGKDISKETQD